MIARPGSDQPVTTRASQQQHTLTKLLCCGTPAAAIAWRLLVRRERSIVLSPLREAATSPNHQQPRPQPQRSSTVDDEKPAWCNLLRGCRTRIGALRSRALLQTPRARQLSAESTRIAGDLSANECRACLITSR